MNAPTPFRHRLPALVLLGVLPALSAAIPLLDCMAGDGRTGVESKHMPGTHGFPHNHLICLQYQASGWVPAAFDPSPPSPEAFAVPDVPQPTRLLFAPAPGLRRPRAPPAA